MLKEGVEGDRGEETGEMLCASGMNAERACVIIVFRLNEIKHKSNIEKYMYGDAHKKENAK